MSKENPASVAASVFHMASGMENAVATTDDLLSAICYIAEALNDPDASGPIVRLCMIGRKDLAKVEQARGEIFHATHCFAFPKREVSNVTS